MTGPVDLLPFAILGAVLGLDVVSFPQAMISRPIVASTLAGALAGNPAAGAVIGATLELFALEMLPIGAARYPEWGSASVVGGVLFAARPWDPGAMTVAVLGALLAAGAGGWTMVVLRQTNAVLARRLRSEIEGGSPSAVVRLQVAGLTLDLVRGFLLTMLALLLMEPVARASVGSWSVDERLSRAIVVALATMVGAGAVWKNFHGTPGSRWFLAGSLVGGVAIIALR